MSASCPGFLDQHGIWNNGRNKLPLLLGCNAHQSWSCKERRLSCSRKRDHVCNRCIYRKRWKRFPLIRIQVDNRERVLGQLEFRRLGEALWRLRSRARDGNFVSRTRLARYFCLSSLLMTSNELGYLSNVLFLRAPSSVIIRSLFVVLAHMVRTRYNLQIRRDVALTFCLTSVSCFIMSYKLISKLTAMTALH